MPAAPITAKPITSTVTVNLPLAQAQETKSYFEIFLDLFRDKPVDVAKSIISTASILNEFDNMPSNLKDVSGGLKNTKNFLGAAEIPKKVVLLSGAVSTLSSGKDASGKDVSLLQRMRNVLKEATSLIKSLYEGFELNSTWSPVSAATKHTASVINFSSTIAGNTNGIVENIQKIANTKTEETEKRTLYAMQAGRDASYLTLGAYGLIAILTVGINPLVILACSTSGLVFTLGIFHYERAVDPESKGANIPQHVIDNVKRQIAVQRTPVAATSAS
ncbi:MAG: hypothetical protein K2P51_03430 [Rhabdochlamydiaceae bacterium]|nr:hypothetical protein [Rhabdochlamydiaceae bacterium]